MVPPGFHQSGKARIYVDAAALRAYVRDLPEVRDTVQAVGSAIAGTASRIAPRRTGALARSITTVRPARAGRPGQTVRVVAGVFYAKFVEFGTRYASPHPFMRPAANAYRSGGSQGG